MIPPSKNVLLILGFAFEPHIPVHVVDANDFDLLKGLRIVEWVGQDQKSLFYLQACTLAHDSGLYAGSRLRPVRWLATRALSYEATHLQAGTLARDSTVEL